MNKVLDLYSDYLIAQNQYATEVGLSDLLEGLLAFFTALQPQSESDRTTMEVDEREGNLQHVLRTF